jgi:hypothetical protein
MAPSTVVARYYPRRQKFSTDVLLNHRELPGVYVGSFCKERHR